MKINILHLIDGAKQARGLTVIIDVFRAFSVSCYAVGNGSEKIIPVGDIGIAYNLKKDNPGFILIGERGGKKPQGFDYGNSPAQIEHACFTGKTIIQTTSSGTQGIANAINADEIITGGFVNVEAIINYIKKHNPGVVSLVAMGTSGICIADEDKLCAEYIKNAIENKSNNFPEIVEYLRHYSSARKFFDPEKDWAPERDFDLCMSLNKFSFVLKVEPHDEKKVILKRIEM